MQQPNWKYFKLDEVLNPVFDDCPFNSWQEMPEEIQKNLARVMELVEYIRKNVGYPIQINSSYRIKDNKTGSPHGAGCAIDFVPCVFQKGWAKRIMEFLLKQTGFRGFRVFWEWSGRNEGWIHVDRGLKDKGGNQFWIGYPKKGKMEYALYGIRSPMEMACMK